ncbi:hypothetical protein T492DRAFT_907122 [Pavlovales sp. CCMP2436]|nr:hypothetical protein T492DRAFT_907122 [Pavlovales sp. CCMP2436]
MFALLSARLALLSVVLGARAHTAPTPVRALLLEHINVNVPDRELARKFYVTALGGIENPSGTNERQLHVNVGVSQFHLPTLRSVLGREPVDVAQRWGGTLELLSSEPLANIAARVQAAGYSCVESGDALAIEGAYGSSLVVRRANPALASAVAERQGHAGGSGSLLALTRATLLCPAGHAGRIARFFSRVLGVLVDEEAGRATVHFESHAGLAAQQLVFEESTDAQAADAYDRSEAAGALEYGQFRIKDCYDPDLPGELGIVFELEVRYPRHRSFPLRDADGALSAFHNRYV